MSVVDDILARESRSMGRPVELIDAHEFADDRSVATVVFYQCESEPEPTIYGRRLIQKRIVVDSPDTKSSIIIDSYYQ